jgi:hypothetical protein
MGITDILDFAGDAIFAAAGQSATFTPTAGAAVTLSVDVSRKTEYQVQGFETGAAGSEITVEAILDDLGSLPTRGATFLVGTTTYTVTHILENDGRFVKCAVK